MKVCLKELQTNFSYGLTQDTLMVMSPSTGGGKPSRKSSSPSFINSQFLPTKFLSVSVAFLFLINVVCKRSLYLKLKFKYIKAQFD